MCTINFGEYKVKARIADSFLKRIAGLMFEDKMQSPMLFKFSQASYHGIWMKNMNFPIDLIWAKDNKIVDIIENVKECRSFNCKTYVPCAPANVIIELDAGAVKRMHLKKSKTFRIS